MTVETLGKNIVSNGWHMDLLGCSGQIVYQGVYSFKLRCAMSEEKKRMEFKLPLFSALTEPILLMGAPPFMIVFNICVVGIFVLSFHFFWVIPLNLAIHVATIYVTKQDADAFECLRSYMQQGRTYNV